MSTCRQHNYVGYNYYHIHFIIIIIVIVLPLLLFSSGCVLTAYFCVTVMKRGIFYIRYVLHKTKQIAVFYIRFLIDARICLFSTSSRWALGSTHPPVR
jgi:hypothetical protein